MSLPQQLHHHLDTPSSHFYGPTHLVEVSDAAEAFSLPPRIISELVDAGAIRSYQIDTGLRVDLYELEQSIHVSRALQGVQSINASGHSVSTHYAQGPHSVRSGPGSMPDLLKVNDVAEYVGVNVRTVRRWIEQGKLKALKGGGALRIRRSDLDKFLRPVVGAK